MQEVEISPPWVADVKEPLNCYPQQLDYEQPNFLKGIEAGAAF